jgi:hypothetical protein
VPASRADWPLSQTEDNAMKINLQMTLAAAMTVTGLLFAPASQAQQIFQPQEEAKFCSKLKDAYIFNRAMADADPIKNRKHRGTAKNLLILAQGNNCRWVNVIPL